jgi:hypothetical protein
VASKVSEKEDLALHPGHHAGAEQFAAIVERTVAQVFSGEVQKVEGVKLKRRGGVIVVLQDVEGGSAGFVEGHNLAINDAVVRQLRESVCYRRKPGREVIPIAGHEPKAPSAFYAKRPVAVELDLVFPDPPFRQLRYGQALHRPDEAGRLR